MRQVLNLQPSSGVEKTKKYTLKYTENLMLIIILLWSYHFSLTLFIPGYFGCCSIGGRGVFHLRPVTPLSLKLGDSDFVQNYFGAGSIFWGKKN